MWNCESVEVWKQPTANVKMGLGARRPVRPCVGAPYFGLIAACYAGMALLLFFIMRTVGSSLEPLSAWSRLESQPVCLRAPFFLMALALGALMVDFTGRFGASLIFDLRHVARVSARRWALYRLSVLSAILIPLGLCLCVAKGAIPYLHGWIGGALFVALLAPAALAAFDLRRASDASRGFVELGAWQGVNNL